MVTNLQIYTTFAIQAVKKNEPIAMYVKIMQDRSMSKGCSSLQLLCNLIGKCDELAYISLTKR